MPDYVEIVEDQAAGLSVDGYWATRVWHISNISQGSPGTSILKVIDDGIDAGVLPAFGATHPDSGGSPPDIHEIYCQELNGEWRNAENTLAKVVATYRIYQGAYSQAPEDTNPDAAIIQVDSSVSTIRTNKDAAGTAIVISLTGQNDQLAEVDVERPNSVLMFQRKETASPASKGRTYTGKVNSTACSSYAAGTLLCLGIPGESQDNGATWLVSYRFQYEPAVWNDQVVVYIDPETDRPHDSVNLSVASTGWESVDLYGTANFNLLNLPWSSA